METQFNPARKDKFSHELPTPKHLRELRHIIDVLRSIVKFLTNLFEIIPPMMNLLKNRHYSCGITDNLSKTSINTYIRLHYNRKRLPKSPRSRFRYLHQGRVSPWQGHKTSKMSLISRMYVSAWYVSIIPHSSLPWEDWQYPHWFSLDQHSHIGWHQC